MTTDYSQFGEQPLILQYFDALKQDFPKVCVDAGAFDGTTGSNTRALFERGWSGLAIEPNPQSFARLKSLYASRSDIALEQVALSDRTERGVPMQFSIGPEGVPVEDQWQYGQVSTLNDYFAKSFKESHGYRYETVAVDVVTLDSLLDKHGIPSDFGFLSVDCEGEDIKILRAFDFQRYRPRLVCVECDDKHRPMYAEVMQAAGYAAVGNTVSNTLFAAKEERTQSNSSRPTA